MVDETDPGTSGVGGSGKGYHYRQALVGSGSADGTTPANDWLGHVTDEYKQDYGQFIGEAYPKYDCFSGYVYALPNSAAIDHAARQQFALHIYGAIETDVVDPDDFVSFSPTLTGGVSNLNAITGSNPYSKGQQSVGDLSPHYQGGVYGLKSQSISEKHDFTGGIAGWYASLGSGLQSETAINRSGSWTHGQTSFSADLFTFIDGNSIGVKVDGTTICVNESNELFATHTGSFTGSFHGTVTGDRNTTTTIGDTGIGTTRYIVGRGFICGPAVVYTTRTYVDDLATGNTTIGATCDDILEIKSKVTASCVISSSSDLWARSIKLKDGIDSAEYSSGYSLLMQTGPIVDFVAGGQFTTINIGSGQSQLTLKTKVTTSADSNIWASGSAGYVSSSAIRTTNITASSNISSSGKIYGELPAGDDYTRIATWLNATGEIQTSAADSIVVGRATLADGLTGTPDITVGNVIATSINAFNITSSFITTSVIVTTGSNQFGDATSDTHTFIGSINATNISASSFTGSFTGSYTGSFTGSVMITGSFTGSGNIATASYAHVAVALLDGTSGADYDWKELSSGLNGVITSSRDIRITGSTGQITMSGGDIYTKGIDLANDFTLIGGAITASGNSHFLAGAVHAGGGPARGNQHSNFVGQVLGSDVHLFEGSMIIGERANLAGIVNNQIIGGAESLIVGQGNVVTNQNARSIVMGYQNSASGLANFVGGSAGNTGISDVTMVYGYGNHSENNDGGIVLGGYNHISNPATNGHHAIGYGLRNSGSKGGSIVLGRYNKHGVTDAIFTIGDGHSDSLRRDVFVARSGSIEMFGQLTMSAAANNIAAGSAIISASIGQGITAGYLTASIGALIGPYNASVHIDGLKGDITASGDITSSRYIMAEQISASDGFSASCGSMTYLGDLDLCGSLQLGTGGIIRDHGGNTGITITTGTTGLVSVLGTRAVAIGGGYGSTGTTIAANGNISADGTATLTTISSTTTTVDTSFVVGTGYRAPGEDVTTHGTTIAAGIGIATNAPITASNYHIAIQLAGGYISGSGAIVIKAVDEERPVKGKEVIDESGDVLIDEETSADGETHTLDVKDGAYIIKTTSTERLRILKTGEILFGGAEGLQPLSTIGTRVESAANSGSYATNGGVF